jgi:hypothetical protein
VARDFGLGLDEIKTRAAVALKEYAGELEPFSGRVERRLAVAYQKASESLVMCRNIWCREWVSTTRDRCRTCCTPLLIACFALFAGCNTSNTVTVRGICRGDSTPAVADTSLVRCSTLDTLARR